MSAMTHHQEGDSLSLMLRAMPQARFPPPYTRWLVHISKYLRANAVLSRGLEESLTQEAFVAPSRPVRQRDARLEAIFGSEAASPRPEARPA